jgi:FkbM family methyltransferase
MLFQRTLKRLGTLLLPEVLKARVRGRMYGYRPARVTLRHSTGPAGAGLTRIEVEGLVPLRVPDGTRDSFFAHLTGNGESIEELHGFIRFARQRDGVLFDIGANHGVFSLAYCAARPANTAVAFEAAAEPLAALGSAASASGLAERIRLEHTWIAADSTGQVVGGIDPNGFFSKGLGEHAVPRTAIDDFVDAAGVRPTMLKIDVEGAELDALDGAVRTLRDVRPVIFLELHHDILERVGIAPATIVQRLQGAGYRFETLLGNPLSARAVVDAPTSLLRFVALPR